VQVDLHSTPALRRGSGRRVPEGFLRRVGWRGFDERGWGGGSAGFGKFGAGPWRADVNGQARGNGVSTPHSPITMQGRREGERERERVEGQSGDFLLYFIFFFSNRTANSTSKQWPAL